MKKVAFKVFKLIKLMGNFAIYYAAWSSIFSKKIANQIFRILKLTSPYQKDIYLPEVPSIVFSSFVKEKKEIYRTLYRSLLPYNGKKNIEKFSALFLQAVILVFNLFNVLIAISYDIFDEIIRVFCYFFPKSKTKTSNELNTTCCKDLLIGVASCTYQDTGNIESSQWHDWEKKVIKNPNNRSSSSAKLFYLYKEDPTTVIALLEKLHINSYRFSIEWSLIQPEENSINFDILQTYIKFCKELLNKNILPLPTLHHFSEPHWFFNKGSFLNKENIKHFISFVEIVMKSFAEAKVDIPYVCTINEPNIEAFSRYVRGSFAPGKKLDFSSAFNFLLGMLEAHNQAYKVIKSFYPNTSIGFTHQYLRFIPGSFLLKPITTTLTHFVNDITLQILQENKYELKIPFFLNLSGSLEILTDFIGVQYYTRPLIHIYGSTKLHRKENMTNMPFREDPEGLYEAITTTFKCASKTKIKPILVTENGISTNCDKQRSRYLKKAIHELKKAKNLLNDNLKGYFMWSFTKNFEWNMGMNPQNFGAYDLIEENQLIKVSPYPKNGMLPFIEWSRLEKKFYKTII